MKLSYYISSVLYNGLKEHTNLYDQIDFLYYVIGTSEIRDVVPAAPDTII